MVVHLLDRNSARKNIDSNEFSENLRVDSSADLTVEDAAPQVEDAYPQVEQDPHRSSTHSLDPTRSRIGNNITSTDVGTDVAPSN